MKYTEIEFYSKYIKGDKFCMQTDDVFYDLTKPILSFQFSNVIRYNRINVSA